MRFVSFAVDTPVGRLSRLGVRLEGAGILDLNAVARWAFAREVDPAAADRLADALMPASMARFLELGERGMAEARRLIRLHEGARPRPAAGSPRFVYEAGSVGLLAPVPEPTSLRDFYAFEEHVATGFAKRNEPIPPAWYEVPVYYKGNHRTIIGPEDVLPWPRYTKRLDFELELAIVIGRTCRNVPEDEAAACIAGYMVMNDLSARDIQRQEMACRLGPAKGKDFATVLGPELVTPDEVGDVTDLPCTVRVNGEVWSESNAGAPKWNFNQMIAHVSQDETLYPGDVFGSGTVGRGCGLELDRWIRPGDVVELVIDRVGTLSNRVGEPGEAAQ